jgi:hypothetical protein
MLGGQNGAPPGRASYSTIHQHAVYQSWEEIPSKPCWSSSRTLSGLCAVSGGGRGFQTDAILASLQSDREEICRFAFC